MSQPIRPTNDLLFKKTLASEEHKLILQGFLQDFLGLMAPVDQIRIENPYSIAAFEEINAAGEETEPRLRQTLRDVAATCPAGDVITEIQMSNETHFDLRAAHYAFSRFCDHYNQPDRITPSPSRRIDRYSSLTPVWSMNIISFNYFPGNQALTLLDFVDQATGRRLKTDTVRLGFFELAKPDPGTFERACWQHYWLTGEALEDAPSYIHDAARIIKYVNLTKQEQTMIDVLDKQRDKIDGMILAGEERGEQRGIQIGQEKVLARLADLSQRHPDADPATILRLLKEDDN